MDGALVVEEPVFGVCVGFEKALEVVHVGVRI